MFQLPQHLQKVRLREKRSVEGVDDTTITTITALRGLKIPVMWFKNLGCTWFSMTPRKKLPPSYIVSCCCFSLGLFSSSVNMYKEMRGANIIDRAIPQMV